MLIICLGTVAEGATSQTVLIRRDHYGIPHILADSEPAAAFAHGYAAAEDHADLMARFYLRAAGRQAEFFGPEFIEQDLQVRLLDIRAESARDLDKLPPIAREILRQYAAGYNSHLATRKNAPTYAMPIGPIDLVAHFRMVLLVDFGIVPPMQAVVASPGSNMWALGRDKTVSGHGMLLVNPHLSWTGPLTMHEVHIRVPGKRDIYGATMVGSPIVTMGFNQFLGWTHTVNQVDISDVYRLTLDPERPDSYIYEGLRIPLRFETAEIRVKDKGTVHTEKRRIARSHYGPILRTDGKYAYALKTVDLEGATYFTQWYEMSRAANTEEFLRALRIHGLPMLNVGYADREGNILYLYGGRVPIRKGHFNWKAPVAGDVSETEWLGIHPFSDMPLIRNPRSGYIQNCNEPPWFATELSGIDAAGIPDYIVSGAIGPRTQISLRMLQERERFSLDDMVRAKFNSGMPVGERLRDELVALLKKNETTRKEFAEAANILREWDTRVDKDSRGAFFFLRWWAEYARTAKSIYREAWSRERPLVTPAGIGDPGKAIQAAVAAIDYIQARRLSLGAPWGEVHRMRRGNYDLPLAGGPMILGCFRSLMFQSEKDGRFSPTYGDSFVLAVEFTNPPTARAVLAYSESSDPSSKHYADQSQIFATDALRPVWFTEQEIAAHLERAYSPKQPDTANAVSISGGSQP